MPFQKLTEVNRPRHVADEVLSSIREGSLLPGERLPSEAKLAELTGVGRTSVREALAALRLMGVVETRVGDGSYICESGSSALVTNGIAEAIEKSQEAVQLQEARAVFECGLVRLAAGRLTADQRQRFDAVLDEMDACARDERYEEYVRLHRDFHLGLAQATTNPILVHTEESFLEFMDHEGWRDMERQALLPNRRDYLQVSADEHRAILDAIVAGDGQSASERMHAHFNRHEEDAHGE